MEGHTKNNLIFSNKTGSQYSFMYKVDLEIEFLHMVRLWVDPENIAIN
jgi:hypothetical protein